MLHDTYPGLQFVNPIGPDLIAEHLIYTQLIQKDTGTKLIEIAFGKPDDKPGFIQWMIQGLTILIRLVRWNQNASEELLTQVLKNRIVRFGSIMFDLIPLRTTVLHEIAIQCGKQAIVENLSQKIPSAVELSRLFNNLSLRYLETRRMDDAIEYVNID